MRRRKSLKLSKIYILHENPQWIGPLRVALQSVAVPFEFWDVSAGCVDFGATPPRGVFYSRMSASAHSIQGRRGATPVTAS